MTQKMSPLLDDEESQVLNRSTLYHNDNSNGGIVDLSASSLPCRKLERQRNDKGDSGEQSITYCQFGSTMTSSLSIGMESHFMESHYLCKPPASKTVKFQEYFKQSFRPHVSF